MKRPAFERAIAAAALSAAAAGPALGADIAQGGRVYNTHCAACHGQQGVSIMPGAPNFARNERLIQPDMMLATAVRNGRNAMPAYIGVLTEREIFDVVAYLRTLFK